MRMAVVRFLLALALVPGSTMAFVGAHGTYTPQRLGSPLVGSQEQSLSSFTANSRISSSRISGGVSLGLSIPRGGAVQEAVTSSGLLSSIANWNKNPTSLFNTSLLALVTTAFAIKAIQAGSASVSKKTTSSDDEKPASIQALQYRYLPVFWLLRMAFWMSGPYLFAVYASKTVNGAPATMAFISRIFLTQFAAIALFGPSVGSLSDQFGRKKAAIAAAMIYTLGALSTASSIIPILFLGRALGGIGTSLMQSAPESWLVSEAQKTGDDPKGKWLGNTFGLAYAGDSMVAILAGQVAGFAAAKKGPIGPFVLSPVFLGIASLFALFTWKDNVAPRDVNSTSDKPSLKEALKVAFADPKILCVGSVQAFFEAAMYVFVLQWPKDMSVAVTRFFGESAVTPFGTCFSCFMACSLLGSTLYGQLAKLSVPAETSMTGMLMTAFLSLIGVTLTVAGNTHLAALTASFFIFEACVGMYFPLIGSLRSKYLPDSHRGSMMNLFGVPLNVMVVGVYLTISKLGSKGAYGVSSAAIGLASLAMFRLQSILGKDKEAATA